MLKLICGNCGVRFAQCPECQQLFEHGQLSQCPNIECLEMNAPLDCVGCGFVVEHDKRGVLNLDMELIPYVVYTPSPE